MQFSCESCKAVLQISDEKVRGKRLIVRCKRCGTQIRISDPALGPIAAAPKRGADPESTRTMETDLLQAALHASRDAGEARAQGDPPVWFAMIGGKQTGPVTRAELGLKTATKQVGPRTYLWKEGMEGWARAQDVGELASLFAPPPAALRAEQPAPAPQTPPVAAAEPEPAAAAGQEPEQPTPAASEPEPMPESHPALRPPASAGANKGEAKPVTSPAPAARPRVVSQQPGILAGQAREQTSPLRAVLLILIIAAVGALIWLALTSGREGSKASPPAEQSKADPAPAAPAPGPDKPPQAKPAEARSPEEAKSAEGAQPAALAPDVVKRKLDESKPALQGCVDEAIKKEPALDVGKIHIYATLVPSGSVSGARIDRKNVDQSPLGACLKSATRRIQFPSFSGDPFEVDIPIVVTGDGQ
jgi:predicted Zn finger-like uncharacterized protein